jgi:8-oxo-dGTP diphosphatase
MKYTGRTATAIIPFSTDKILLIKRRTVPFRDYWALPGGRVDPGETVEQTIRREVKEETGVQNGVAYDYYPACFLVKVVGGEIRKQESEIEEIKLFSLKDVPATLAFEHAQMIKDYLTIRKTSV